MGVLGVLAMLAALATPAVAQDEEYGWKTDGKRYWRTEEAAAPALMPATYLKEVPAGEQKAGDVQGFQYLGSGPRSCSFAKSRSPKPRRGTSAPGRWCNGAEKPCPGMNAAGECLGMK
jgi:hypothetical protein